MKKYLMEYYPICLMRIIRIIVNLLILNNCRKKRELFEKLLELKLEIQWITELKLKWIMIKVKMKKKIIL